MRSKREREEKESRRRGSIIGEKKKAGSWSQKNSLASVLAEEELHGRGPRIDNSTAARRLEQERVEQNRTSMHAHIAVLVLSYRHTVK